MVWLLLSGCLLLCLVARSEALGGACCLVVRPFVIESARLTTRFVQLHEPALTPPRSAPIVT